MIGASAGVDGMANYKRGKTKRQVRCTLCTPNRWRGNSKERFKARDGAAKSAASDEIRAACHG
jgi:hypothetical protein